MVTYSSSTASRTITVGQLVYPTSLTLTVPASVAEKTPFTVSGRLTYVVPPGAETGLGGRTVTITGGDAPKTATTAGDGSFTATLTISTFGTYTVTAAYAGEAGLAASTSGGPLSVSGDNALMWLVAGVIVLALAAEDKAVQRILK